MKVLAGLYHDYTGDILIDGVRKDLFSPNLSKEAGIGMVYQHFMLVENMTVAENVLLGQEGGFLLDPAAMRAAVADFRPDAILTVNHLGVDHEGVLYSLADDLRLPIVSWFVDNPEFILPLFPKPDPEGVLVLSWDLDSLPALSRFGFTKTGWLPLGADEARFAPGRADAEHPGWRARVSFVGNSMPRSRAMLWAAISLVALALEALVKLAVNCG